jgi:hypothetical protein
MRLQYSTTPSPHHSAPIKDGSQLVELENGSLLLLEGKSSKALVFAEQPAPYRKPLQAER